jgi:hypothetical protein
VAVGAAGTVTLVSSSAPARVVFGLLVAATVGAFFVTQRLKREDPVVKQIRLQLVISPNGDGRKDTATVGFELPERDDVTVSMVDSDGDEVRRLARARPLRAGEHRFTWDGRDDAGRVPPDGEYFVRVTLRDEGRSARGPRGILVDTTPPRARILSVAPRRTRPGRAAGVRIAFDGPASPPAEFRVWRTEGRRAAEVARFLGRRNERFGVWDGRVRRRPAPPGNYTFSVTVQDKALVAGSSPPRLPPTPESAEHGFAVAGTELAVPLEPVRAGGLVRSGLLGVRGRYRWSLAPLSGGRVLRRGRGAGGQLAFRVPARARTGVYLLRIVASAGAATAPVAIRGRGSGRVLVVLPAIDWQGRNPRDNDGDGFGETLDAARAVDVDRPFAGGRLPTGFASEVAPLLRFLDRRKLRYELTTDLALARGRGAVPAGRPGVVLAGDERWLTEPAIALLRDHVRDGGKLALFGSDSLRRRVELQGSTLRNPTPPQRANAFGEVTSPLEIAAAPLVVTQDRLALFRGSDGFVGLFTRFDQSELRAEGARLLTAAGRAPSTPAFVGYGLGEGTIVRVGTDGWSAALASAPEVSRVTSRLWAFLSR